MHMPVWPIHLAHLNLMLLVGFQYLSDQLGVRMRLVFDEVGVIVIVSL